MQRRRNEMKLFYVFLTFLFSTNASIVIEHICSGHSQSLQCSGGGIPTIHNASYGRIKKDVCPDESSWFEWCKEIDVTENVRKECGNKTTCQLSAKLLKLKEKPKSVDSTQKYTKYCERIQKYLKVNYSCTDSPTSPPTTSQPTTTITPLLRNKTGPTLSKTICQFDYGKINCNANGGIEVVDVFWGRKNPDLCKSNFYDSTKKCDFAQSDLLEVVKEQCDGRKECLFFTEKWFLGDPCKNIAKYLEIKYRCHIEVTIKPTATITNPTTTTTNPTRIYPTTTTTNPTTTTTNPTTTTTYPTTTTTYPTTTTTNPTTTTTYSTTTTTNPTTTTTYSTTTTTNSTTTTINESTVATTALTHNGKDVTICSGTTETIECADGNVIDIIHAWYGRKEPSNAKVSCGNENGIQHECDVNATRNVTFLCGDTRVCHLTATDDFFESATDCSGVPKNLEISYTCKPHVPSVIQPTKSSVTPSFDGLRLYVKTLEAGFNSIIGCVNNTVLYIHTARFGADGCYVDAKKLLTFNCNGLARCFLSATIGTHGEPCTGVNAGKSKNLEIQYYCADKVGEDPPTPVPPLSLVQTPPSEGIPPVTGLPKHCGRRSVPIGRIINGVNAKPGLWPWQAAIYRNRATFGCGGSLLNSNWIVTAAHCFGTSGANTPEKYTVVLGDFNRTKSEGHEYVYNVTQVIRHPQYNPGSLGTFSHDNDVALMKIEPNVGFTDYISPVCLDSGTNENFAEKCFLTGWGKPTFPGNPSYILQQGFFEAVNDSACQTKLNAAPGDSGTRITANMLCATHTTDLNQSGCQADSGGPFVCFNKKDSQWYLRGVVSWGSARCSINDMFQVLAKISAVREWISQTINRN